MTTTTTTPRAVTHYILRHLSPGDVNTACFALEAVIRLGKEHGAPPLTREEAELWLSTATFPVLPDGEGDVDEAFLQWRLDNIFQS